MLVLKVHFANRDYLVTKFNGTMTQALEYYVGNVFTLGLTEDTNQMAVKVEILTQLPNIETMPPGFTDKYECEVCGKFISEAEGITTINGLWVCDDDSCRTLDEENEATEKSLYNLKKASNQ